jgi:hypothetical protein
MAISDIVAERPVTATINCNVSLWAACIGGPSKRIATEARSNAPG